LEPPSNLGPESGVFPQERLAKWKTYRHSSLYAWHHSNSRCNGVESVERTEKAQVGSEKLRLVKVDEIYHQKDGFCRVRGSFGVPFKQQDTHYKPPSFFHMVFGKTFPNLEEFDSSGRWFHQE